MMNTKSYLVLEEYVDTPDIQPNLVCVLKNLKKGDVVSSTDLTQYIPNVKEHTKYQIASEVLRQAEKIGIISNVLCSIDKFEEFETVSYWTDQLKQIQVKNIKKRKKAGTQYAYVSHAGYCVMYEPNVHGRNAKSRLHALRKFSNT
ncbi:MAG: hypothetical protein COA77_00345 [Thaumarchaeota archaeon]|nr:MAG: hypothetical protein COA77_00345 [Nitrososphaerota archaeon]